MSDLNQAMVDFRFRPNQKFSQNFIIDEKLVEKIVSEANLKKTDVVLEIGSGSGSLTNELLKHCKVVGVELDEKMIEILKSRFLKEKKFQLVEGSILDVKLPKFNKIVALPPYNISGDIMVRLFKEDFELALLVFQREFVEKIVAEPGFKEYSYLSVLTDQLFEPKILIQSVSPRSFFPKPEAYSSLLKLKRKNPSSSIKNFPKFISFLKNVFRYKNKDFPNALKNCVKSMKNDFKKFDPVQVCIDFEIDDLKTNLLETENFVDVFKKISRE
ncbi:MAG: 16S rRNA (adenine(1518)-N(6)/adenine(1519)-N(6))-dimethyltransferase RsmA [archaeon]|nr:16S rRNA (adenine(1518)-N(6)/adenine(1519)-N(6))-dimethyltransferase RsmA [archaeon]